MCGALGINHFNISDLFFFIQGLMKLAARQTHISIRQDCEDINLTKLNVFVIISHSVRHLRNFLKREKKRTRIKLQE